MTLLQISISEDATVHCKINEIVHLDDIYTFFANNNKKKHAKNVQDFSFMQP